MQRKSVKVFGKCYEPGQTHSYNYMFDTTALNKLAERPQDVQILMQASKLLGYEYFLCRIQEDEIVGQKSDGTFHKKFSEKSPKSLQMRKVIETLSIQKIPCLAKFVQRGIATSDISYLKNSNGKLYDIFESVFSGKIDNLEDAIIVESGMRHNCIVISTDRAMCDKTRSLFPNKAMWYDRFINETKEKIMLL